MFFVFSFSIFTRRLRSEARRAVILLVAGCLSACTPAHSHGTISSKSVASGHDWKACEHEVPEEVCARCHPELVADFKAEGDWCKEHDRPESQCLECHPDLDFSPPMPPPEAADVQPLAPPEALEPHRVTGKFTVFDFYAAWCPPCRKVDEHLYSMLDDRRDIAVRKIDIGSWESPVAKKWLEDVRELPFLVVFSPDGRRVAEIQGADFEALDTALQQAKK
jgi:thiol-disulfide isomerase/thioredoxin